MSAPDRSTTIAVNTLREFNIPRATQQRNAFLGFGFVPRLTLVGRGSWMEGPPGSGFVRDISVNAQFLLAHEGAWSPSLAAGAQDLGSVGGGREFGSAHPYFKNKYVVASRSLLGRARVSLGYGSSAYAYSLDGAFGGLELSPCSWITAIAENDGHRRNVGARIAPLGDWGARHGVEPTIDLLWREGQGRIVGVGLRIQSGSPARQEHDPTAPSSVQPRGAPVSDGLRRNTETLGAALVAHGFENVRATVVGDTITVAYENRVYNRDEWRALGIVMAEASRHADAARTLKVTLLKVDLPVLEVVSGIAAFDAFVSGAADRTAFASQLTITNPTSGVAGAPSNASRIRLDVTARPRVEQLLLTDVGVYEARLSVVPEATMQLATGISVSGRHAIVVHRTSNYPLAFGDPNVDQLLVHAARRGLPFSGAVPGLISQVSVGQFGPGQTGAAAEFDDVVADGRVSLGGVVGAFGARPAEPTGSVAYGSIKVRHAPLDLALSLTAGRFAHGDVGSVGEIERRFGLSEVAFYAQSTSFASMAGIRVSVPLTFARDARPGTVRFRLPDYADISQQSQVLAFNAVRSDVALPLEIGPGVARTFRGRDRLYAPRLVRELETVRAAARDCGCMEP